MEFTSPSSTKIPRLPAGARLCYDDEQADVGDWELDYENTWQKLLLTKPDFFRLGNGQTYATLRPDGQRPKVEHKKGRGKKNRQLSTAEILTIQARWAKRPTYKRLAEEYEVPWRVIQDAILNRKQRRKMKP